MAYLAAGLDEGERKDEGSIDRAASEAGPRVHWVHQESEVHCHLPWAGVGIRETWDLS